VQTYLLDTESSDSLYTGLQIDVKGFRSLKVYLAVMYDAVYKYQLLELSGPEREKDQQKSLQRKLRSRGKTGKQRK